MRCHLHPRNTKYIREHSFYIDVVIDAQYTKMLAGRFLPQIPVLETLIFFQDIFVKPMQPINRMN
jgi:hypothetical protein